MHGGAARGGGAACRRESVLLPCPLACMPRFPPTWASESPSEWAGSVDTTSVVWPSCGKGEINGGAHAGRVLGACWAHAGRVLCLPFPGPDAPAAESSSPSTGHRRNRRLRGTPAGTATHCYRHCFSAGWLAQHQGGREEAPLLGQAPARPPTHPPAQTAPPGWRPGWSCPPRPCPTP